MVLSCSGQYCGWVMAVIGCLISKIELGTFKSIGVFLLPILESLSGSYTAVGTAMAASYCVCYICGKSQCAGFCSSNYRLLLFQSQKHRELFLRTIKVYILSENII